jgi:hypothetical protein
MNLWSSSEAGDILLWTLYTWKFQWQTNDMKSDQPF